MKAILEFNLPDDEAEYRYAREGGAWSAVVGATLAALRNVIKHGGDEPMRPSDIRKMIYDEMNHHGLSDE